MESTNKSLIFHKIYIFVFYTLLHERRIIIRNITKIINSLGTTIVIDINSKNNQNGILDEIEKMIFDYNDKWSLYNTESLLNSINNSNEYIIVDDDTEDIINKSILYSNQTNGYFDITTANLNLLWKDSIKTKIPPDKKEINKELRNIDYKKISIKNKKIKIGNNQKIDLGGIAKGYILDKIIDILKEKNINSGIINLGGTIHVIGENDIGIRNPFKPINNKINDDYVIKVKLNNESIVTSGIYEQEAIIDGISYNHIINPKTGYPCNNNLISVTLIGDNACMMDAYATAIFNMNLNDSIKLLKKENIEGIFIFKNGNIFVTDNLKNKIEMRDANENK